MHRPPEEGNFCDKHGETQKPVIVDYSRQMGYIDNGTEWPTAVQSLGEHGSGQKIVCSTLGHDSMEQL